MANDTRYNGWTNYETWNLALWLGNEQGSSEFWQDQTWDAYRHAHATTNPTFTRKENAAFDLADRLKAEIQENCPEVTGFYADVLNAAISEVNWYEIAENWLDDLDVSGNEDEDDEVTA